MFTLFTGFLYRGGVECSIGDLIYIGVISLFFVMSTIVMLKAMSNKGYKLYDWSGQFCSNFMIDCCYWLFLCSLFGFTLGGQFSKRMIMLITYIWFSLSLFSIWNYFMRFYSVGITCCSISKYYIILLRNPNPNNRSIHTIFEIVSQMNLVCIQFLETKFKETV